MWEAIQANTRRSRLLISLMGAILVGFGALFGAAFFGPDAAVLGAVAALVVWGVLLGIALLGGDQVVLLTAGARQIRKEDAPRLWNVVEEMTIASGLGRMPRVYVVDDEAPNAFATGRRQEIAAIAVTSGLLKRLNRDELQGVVAHEIGHIKNRDVHFMTLALVMMGSIALLSDMALRFLWYGGGRRRGAGRGGGQAQLALLGLVLLAAVLAPLFAQLLYFACSRRREFLADASGARFTRYPPGLASALDKIAGGLRGARRPGLRAMAPMYIVNPLRASGATGLFSTHPPVQERIRILRAMSGASWLDYEDAFRKVTDARRRCLDQATVRSEGRVAIRPPTPDPQAPPDAVTRAREATDLVDRLVGFLLLPCLCGLRLKIPPQHTADTIRCPRCGRAQPLPRAEAAAGSTAAAGGAAATPAPDTPLRYRRRGGGWESFRCACGRTQQLSPALSVSRLTCKACGRRIDIEAG